VGDCCGHDCRSHAAWCFDVAERISDSKVAFTQRGQRFNFCIHTNDASSKHDFGAYSRSANELLITQGALRVGMVSFLNADVSIVGLWKSYSNKELWGNRVNDLQRNTVNQRSALVMNEISC
jgi:hypothetical protein